MAPTNQQPFPNPSEDPLDEARFRLDPGKFPRRLDLELEPRLLERLEAMAASSGRSLSDLITDLLSRQMDPLP